VTLCGAHTKLKAAVSDFTKAADRATRKCDWTFNICIVLSKIINS